MTPLEETEMSRMWWFIKFKSNYFSPVSPYSHFT